MPLPEGLEAFRALARAGEDLFRLHADYEELELWPLEVEEAPGAPEDPYQRFRIEQPRLDAAKRVIRYNDWITIRGLPEAAFTWRPGGYGPLEWIVRYWRVATKVEGPPKRRIIWDPNHVPLTDPLPFDTLFFASPEGDARTLKARVRNHQSHNPNPLGNQCG